MPELNDLSSEEEKQFAQGQPRGFPFDPEFRMEDVMLPEDDNMGIDSEDDEVAEEEIQTETGFGSVIGMTYTPNQRIHHSRLHKYCERKSEGALDMQLWTTFPRSLLKSKRSLQR